MDYPYSLAQMQRETRKVVGCIGSTGHSRWQWGYLARPVLAVALLFAGLLLTTPAHAQATTVTTDQQIPIAMTVYVPCSLNGTGEEVALSGTLHVLSNATADGSGGFHIDEHFNPQGVSGVGMTSGTKYQGTGVTLSTFNTNGALPFESTYVNNFRVIGQGPGNNLLIHENEHITVNADGTVTAAVDNFSDTCQ